MTEKRWTAQENAIVMKMIPRDAAEVTGRSYAAVVVRRHNLRHPENLARAKQRVRWGGWKEDDCRLLREKFVTVKRIADLIDVFDGRFALGQIKAKARRMKLKRKFLGNAKVPIEGHQELNDQIRIRAKEDGIALYKLDDMLGTGSYFKYNAHRRRANLVPNHRWAGISRAWRRNVRQEGHAYRSSKRVPPR